MNGMNIVKVWEDSVRVSGDSFFNFYAHFIMDFKYLYWCHFLEDYGFVLGKGEYNFDYYNFFIPYASIILHSFKVRIGRGCGSYIFKDLDFDKKLKLKFEIEIDGNRKFLLSYRYKYDRNN